jgi:tetratricopeptide (TPR) repeat protein
MTNNFRTLFASVLTLAASAGGVLAQGQPQCRLSYRGNFRLNGAQQYLDRAQRTEFADEKNRSLNDANRVLSEAVRAGGLNTDQQLTLWYFFGRLYAMRGDLVGADTSWSRVEAMGDDVCKRDVARLRRNEYVPIWNDAVGLLQQQQDSALRLLRRAMIIFRGEPALFMNMAAIFVDRNEIDSAAAYYRQVARIDTAEHRRTALFNTARMFHRAATDSALAAAWAGGRAGRADPERALLGEAERAYREYLELYPRDIEARSSLAAVLGSLGRGDEALSIYDSLLAMADSLDPFDLFDAGVVLYRERRYQQAARAFEGVLRRNPHYRDALFNLATSYDALNDTTRFVASAHRLRVSDPNNRQTYTLLARAFQKVMRGHAARDSALRRHRTNRDSIAAANRVRQLAVAYSDSTIWAVAYRDSIPFEFNVSRFEPRDTMAVVQGAVQNLQSAERPAFTLTIELVNGQGEVVATLPVEVPALSPVGQPGSVYDFNLSASGRGILAYRYRAS